MESYSKNSNQAQSSLSNLDPFLNGTPRDDIISSNKLNQSSLEDDLNVFKTVKTASNVQSEQKNHDSISWEIDDDQKIIHALWILSERYTDKAYRMLEQAENSIANDEKKTLLKGYAELVIFAIKCLIQALDMTRSCATIDDKRKLDYEFVCYELLFFAKFRFSSDFNVMEECLVKAMEGSKVSYLQPIIDRMRYLLYSTMF